MVSCITLTVYRQAEAGQVPWPGDPHQDLLLAAGAGAGGGGAAAAARPGRDRGPADGVVPRQADPLPSRQHLQGLPQPVGDE